MRITLVCLLLATALPVAAQPDPDPAAQPLRWRGTATPAAPLAIRNLPDTLAAGTRHLVVRFASRLDAPRRGALAEAGITLLDPLGPDTWFVRFDNVPDNDARDLLAGATLRPLEPAQRLHPLLINRRDALSAWHGQPRLPISIVLHRGIQLDPDLRGRLAALDLRIRGRLRSLNAFAATAPREALDTLATFDEIAWIEPAGPPLTPTNDAARAAARVDPLQAPEFGLDGTGVRALIFDSGIAQALHPDFGGRVTVIDNAGIVDHSTHVAGTVGGDGTLSDGRYRGMAPNVTLLSAGLTIDPNQIFFYLDAADIEADYDLAINAHDAQVANNSLGTNTESSGFPCEIQGDYGVAAGLYDAIVRGSLGRPLVVVLSAGNERASTRCDVEGFGDYYSTSPPATNKNCITVGALNANNDSLTTFSSWGPTDDGRLRPDVCAPGCQSNEDLGVTSTVNGGQYNALCGTSMSAPVVTGIVALLLQDDQQRNPGQPDPLPATIRALLAHTADDLGPPGPDYRYGYGAVRADAAIAALRAENHVEGSLTDGRTAAWVINVPPDTDTLRLTLAWDDAPGAFNIVPNLVNDLDLRVTGPDGTRHFPWTLDPLAPAALAVRTGVDRTNNLEQVRIDNPPAGTWRVDIVGHAVPVGPQTFGLHATHPLRTCTDLGTVAFRQSEFPCNDAASFTILDCDAPDQIDVLVHSGSDPGGRTVTAARDPNDIALRGTITLDETGLAGLRVSDGDTLELVYTDDTSGQQRTATAGITCGPLVVTAVQSLAVETTRATVRVETSRPARVRIDYGPTCGSNDLQAVSQVAATTHDLNLRDLPPDTTTHFRVRLEAPDGTVTLDDNNGACWSVTTPPVAPQYAEEFLFSFDLPNHKLTFTPDGASDRYVACVTPSAGLPLAPLDGTRLEIPNGQSLSVPLAEGRLIRFFGEAYDRVIVGSDGYVSFGRNDPVPGGYTGHFRTPRVSGMLTGLDPNAAGAIRWQQTDDRVAVTWYRVPTLGRDGERNTFQIGLLFDGRIEIDYRRVDAFYGVAGISAGNGTPADFVASDLSTLTDCPVAPTPTALGYRRTTFTGTPLVLPLAHYGDPNQVPRFTLHTLPALPIRDLDTGDLLDPADLPIAFEPGPVALRCEPLDGFVGHDALTFSVADHTGTSPPATIDITVTALAGLPLTDTFDTGSLDPERWIEILGATTATLADDPPSAPGALRLNGDPVEGDRLASVHLDLADQGPVLLEYAWQRGGNAAAPGPLSQMRVEVLTTDGVWQTLGSHNGIDEPSPFVFDAAYLPPEALQRGGRIRFVSRGDLGPFDDWFVDDVSLRASTEPLAQRASVTTNRATPANIELTGYDPEDQPLAYVITRLPRRGTLADPNSGPIADLPYTLTGPSVRYYPAPRTVGTDDFGFATDDGTLRSRPADITVRVRNRVVLHRFPLDDDPGWQRDDPWQFGPLPSGHDSSDPNAAFTGENVFGTVLGGDYPASLAGPRYLTTPALPLRGRTEPELRFRRWLHNDFQDDVAIEVSVDGDTWDEIWPQRTNVVARDEEWTLVSYNLSGVVGKQDESLRIRWSLGPTSPLEQAGGWNLDDIEIIATDVPCPADLNGNARIDLLDLVILLNNFGELSAGGSEYGDLTGDGRIDLTDLADLLSQYGDPCP